MPEKDLEIDVSPEVRKLKIATRGSVSSNFVGNYRSTFKGRGLEFDGYRAYAPGVDDASLIDWKASQRAPDLVVKEFIEERNIDVLFLHDVCTGMVFGSLEKLKQEYAAELTASLAYAVLEAGDCAGLALYSNEITKKVPPASGSKQFYVLLKTLADRKNYGGECDLANALKQLDLVFKTQGGLLIIVSDFLGLKDDYSKCLRIACKKFDVIGMMVRDPRDKFLPEGVGQIFLEDPRTGKQVLVDVSEVRHEYEKAALEQENEVKKNFLESGAEIISLETDKKFVNPIITFFKKRSRQWR